MTQAARYLPPADNRVGSNNPNAYKPHARVLIETLPGVRVTAGGRSFEGGPYVIEVPAEDVPKLQAKVRDHDEWARAERTAARKRADAQKANKPFAAITAASVYHSDHGKGGGSLLRVEVLEDDLPAPLGDEERKLAQVMAHVHAQTQAAAGRIAAIVAHDDSDSDDDATPAPRRRGRPPKSQD